MSCVQHFQAIFGGFGCLGHFSVDREICHRVGFPEESALPENACCSISVPFVLTISAKHMIWSHMRHAFTIVSLVVESLSLVAVSMMAWSRSLNSNGGLVLDVEMVVLVHRNISFKVSFHGAEMYLYSFVSARGLAIVPGIII
jgi:hypothetical protein